MRHSAPKGGVKRADKKAVIPLTRSKNTASHRGLMKSEKSKRSVRKKGVTAKAENAEAVQAQAPASAEIAAVDAALANPAPVLVSMKPDAHENPAVSLPANCCMRDTAELKASLLQLVDHEQTVLVDANAVERIDTAAMQVLVSFARERMAAARVTEWRGMKRSSFAHATIGARFSWR